MDSVYPIYQFSSVTKSRKNKKTRQEMNPTGRMYICAYSFTDPIAMPEMKSFCIAQTRMTTGTMSTIAIGPH